MAKNKKTDTPMTDAPMTDAPTDAAQVPAEVSTEAKVAKSIVPNKYAGKYKNGGSDALAEFIKAQSVTEGVAGFSFPAFFSLCRANGLDEAKVAHYEAQVTEKRHGAQGRARMTLRNMLATLVRKNSKLVGVDGVEYEVALPKLAVSGAAAKAQAEAAPTAEQAAE